MESKQSNKAHRSADSNKQTAKKKLHSQGYNAKAFAVSAPKKLERMAKRSSEKTESRLHVPMVNRTPDDDPPPVIVAVVGPPGTGKTTLIKSLVRRLTKTSLTEVKGPITVVSGKRRRLTFIEVTNDLNSMIDIAKIADLVLLMIDGNFGLEMETMEFLNIAQHHGMPRVLGVATHLDLFKSQATLRTSKKKLKHRFWTEVYQGAKLFYLSGVMNGRYPDREILNLTRFLSVMKFRPLQWRNEHPYLLCDRVTDLTHPALIEKNPICDRKIAIYGYLRGTSLPFQNARVHLAGVGDYTVSSVEKLPDPCPTPYFEQKLEELEREQAKISEQNGETIPKIRRARKRLEDKQKIIYAPMSDVHGVLIDKDAVYIDVGKEESFNNENGELKGIGEKLVVDLQNASNLANRNYQSGLKLFSNSKELNDNGQEIEQDEQGLLGELEEEEEEEEEENSHNFDSGRKTLRKPRVYGKPITEADENENFSDNEEEEDDDDAQVNYNIDDDDENEAERKLVDINFDNSHLEENENYEFYSDSELDDLNEENDWKAMGSKLQNSHNVKRKWDLNELLYLNNIDPNDVIKRWRQEEDELSNDEALSEEAEEEAEDFFQKKEPSDKTDEDLDHFQPMYKLDELKSKWEGENRQDAFNEIKSRFFVAPKIKKGGDDDGDAEDKDNDGEEDDDDDVYGDFEDLENGEGGAADEEEQNQENEDEEDFPDFDAEEEEGDNSSEEDEIDPSLPIEEKRALNAKKKEQLALQFEAEEGFGEGDDFNGEEHDTWYDLQKAKMSKQLEINKKELEEMDELTRNKIEGFKSGSYVKLTFNNLPKEFIENLNPVYPIIVGGLLSTEERFGFLNVRIRKHRWHKKILKSNDPLILSLGWRRFQTLPIYTTTDSRTRTRMLKYTPEHAYCNGTFYGPLVAPNTTFCGVQVVANTQTTGSFRIAATGVVEDLNSSTEIVKKLKLVGYPYKIFRNTAFIKDMFSTALEVAKFEGASIKTVSGIRGEIKRALSKPEGHFRATFEDKILLSDIIILRTWYPVQVKKFYNPVTSLLLEDKTDWKGMRLTGQIRHENGIETQMDANSQYSKIERVERRFNPLRVPKSIQADLPFKSQIHQMKPQKKTTYMQKRAVVLNGDEKKARSLIQTISTIKNHKDEKRNKQKREKFKEKLKKFAKEDELRAQKEKERKKDYFAKQGQKKRFGGSGDRDGDSKKRRS
ncbi:hypothetical protein PACTADRAFT_48627 [Pachysolen tannophilus NRRL Y-2460]|uniref:Bms1-type G domain-containing protein n=1 Tax=Pachysolen tannophilus NRRL Y-2460 TaxID=669874 RepID=A0A1E4TYJ5_PACTA|nr:hypothetical protein PACTADRAFT_48627 [Pachysolen tannophilus NRRL Y-2460]